MHSRTFRYLAGALGAAAMVATLGATAAQASTAGAHASKTGATIYSKDVSGYETTGRWFRFVTVTGTLPSNALCKAEALSSPGGAGVAVTLGSAEEATTGVSKSLGDASAVGVSYVPTAEGCGLISPSFVSNVRWDSPQFPAGAITLLPGQAFRLDLYYNQANQSTTATVFNLTAGTQAQESMHGSALYSVASATAGFGPLTPPSSQYRVLQASNAQAATYSGVRGSFGQFLNDPIVVTDTAAAGGTVLASPSALWNNGASFGVWLRTS